MKKCFKQLLLPVVLSLSFFSNSNHAAVTVLGWPGGPEEEALRAVTKVYNARPEVAEADKVELIFFSRDGFFDKLQADLAAGSDAFDANLLATYSIGRYAPYLKPIELDNKATDTFGETILQTMQFNGKQYGVPTDLSLHFMYYRKDLIDALLNDIEAAKRYAELSEKYLGKALQPKAPDEWSWDDYAATALYFTKSLNPDSPTRYGTVLQMKNLLFNMMVWHAQARAEGGNWMDDKGNITVDSPAFRTALQRYKMLYDAGTSPKDSLSYEYAEANAAFGAGQVAAMLQWNAATAELMDAEKSPNIADKVAIVAPPSGSAGRFTHIHGLGFGLNAKAKNEAGARAFLQWLSEEDSILSYAKSGGAPGLTAKAAAKIADQRPDLAPVGRFASEYGFVMNGGTAAKALSVYELQAKEFTGYWAGQQSLDEALQKTQQGMTKLLAQ